MDQAQMLQLAQTFQESLEKDLQALQFALSQQDAQPIQRLLHSLKGYVTFLCEPGLSQQMIQLEAMSRSTHLNELIVDVSKTVPSLQILLTEIRQWIDNDLKSPS